MVAPSVPLKGNKKVKKIPTRKLEKSKTLLIAGEREIAADFAMKVYENFDQMIKSVILFGSSAKKASTPESDIDVIIIIDDVSVRWDQELIAWYREELGKLIKDNPYRKSLHINSVKLSTWWEDMMRGDRWPARCRGCRDCAVRHTQGARGSSQG